MDTEHITVLTNYYSRPLALSLAHCFTPAAEILVLDRDEANQALHEFAQHDFPFCVNLKTDTVITP